jgi:hypothetical protein
MLFLSTAVAALHSWTVLLRLLVAFFSASSLDSGVLCFSPLPDDWYAG